MRKFIVGNWKMNGLLSELPTITAIRELAVSYSNVDTALCLPAPLIASAVLHNDGYIIGAQDCHQEISGAYTGCISAQMLAEAGAKLTILGHSERRGLYHENDALVRAKALAAQSAGLSVIICIGETREERDRGETEHIVLGQLSASVPDDANSSWVTISYEPVWAIGTGLIPSLEDVAQIHAAIRGALVQRFGDEGMKIRILYGGSMNGDNAASLLAIDNVNGGLIGGASLTAAKFEPIVAAASVY